MSEPTPTPAPVPDGAARPRRAGLAVAATVLGAGLVLGGAAVGLRVAGQSSQPAYQVPTTTTEQLPFTGSQRRFGTSYGDPRGMAPQTGTQQTSDATTAQSQGVVEITSTLTNGKAAGTGMVLRSDGVVVTNHHVVQGATAITVTLPTTGQTYSATYVGGDATRDIAVLKLTGASGLTTAHLDSSGVTVGDTITSVGDAGGDGGSLSAAPGTVSAKDDAITVNGDDGTAHRLTGLIRLDADLVPGDSGGAVLDSSGDVVGMNVAASTGDANVTGYAIPIATVSAVVDQILSGTNSGTVDLGYHGYLGVGLDPSTTVPLVVTVSDSSAAARARIAVGSTITSVDGTRIRTATQLRSLLAQRHPGDRATIGWITSSGTHRTATVTLGQAPVA